VFPQNQAILHDPFLTPAAISSRVVFVVYYSLLAKLRFASVSQPGSALMPILILISGLRLMPRVGESTLKKGTDLSFRGTLEIRSDAQTGTHISTWGP